MARIELVIVTNSADGTFGQTLEMEGTTAGCWQMLVNARKDCIRLQRAGYIESYTILPIVNESIYGAAK